MKILLSKLYNTIRNLIIDIRFGSPLFGYKKTNVPGHYWVVNTDYSVLPHIFTNRIGDADCIVDIGCGRGRVINWLIYKGYQNKIIGIEYDAETASTAKKRLRKFSNVTITQGDALENIPLEGTVFYLFNPFDEKLMIQFRDKIQSLFLGRKKIVILYYRPLHIDVFRDESIWKIEEIGIPLEALDSTYKNRHTHRQYAVIEFQGEVNDQGRPD